MNFILVELWLGVLEFKFLDRREWLDEVVVVVGEIIISLVEVLKWDGGFVNVNKLGVVVVLVEKSNC